ncbi:lysylphosphatidylglycerol synthase transmembrane domain-containing protein [Streptomyces sp. NPDC047000]|uniref:lysylphosphatidylglycerol synthase transmembrane domain-containing protein n=1 Tax=Streptomyces sp. NPDC047000 TaxID=3155474 RepID=UPI0033CFEBE3
MSLLPLEDPSDGHAVPAREPSPAEGPRGPVRLPRPPLLARSAGPARHGLVLLPLLLITAWAVTDSRSLRDNAARIPAADPWWLLSAVVCTCLGWVAAACVRQGAVVERLPPGPLLASQFAAGTANHLLPASIGAHAVTLRFLQRQGVPLARASASIALYSLVKPVAKTAVLVVFLVLFPGMLRLRELLPGGQALFLTVAGAAIAPATAAVLFAAVRPLRRRLLAFLRTALHDARTLHTRPARVLALWGGAAATPVLQASVIASAGAALGLGLSWAQVVFAFLVASTATGAVPAPGGIGPVDAALVLTLSAAYGTPVALGTATVVAYRVLTVWVPLVPGALVLSAMVHRRML